MKTVVIFSLILLLGFTGSVFSQNNTCANMKPFCTGQTMNFPATTGVPNSQPGPAYGCLGSQPNPAWFFMQMASAGTMSIAMSAASDIDFICWGPFSNPSSACGNLTAGNIKSCSYSPSNTETCTIANALPGEFYVMLITNFSNQNQGITFNQIGQNGPNAATSNCDFVCVVSASLSTKAVCAGQNVTLSIGPGTSTSVLTYTFTGPNSFTSTLPSNIFTNIQTNSSYTIVGTNSVVINGWPTSGTCQAVVTVSVIQYPGYTLTPTTASICQGGNFFANVTFTAQPINPANYTYQWSPFSGAGVWQPTSNSTLISPTLLPVNVPSATVVYTVTVAPSTTLIYCPVTKTLEVNISNPLTPTIALPPLLCNTSNSIQLSGLPLGGTWSGNTSLSPGGQFNPVSAPIGTSSVVYGVTVGNCIVKRTETISVSKFYPSALTTTTLSTMCVQDAPFQLMNIAQNTLTGMWSLPLMVPQSPINQFNPAGLPSGAYTLTYITKSLPNNVCPDQTTLTVNVFNPPTPTITPILPQCTNGATVQLTAIPLNGVWSGASGVFSNGVQIPSANNTINTNTVTYAVGQGTCLAYSTATFQVSQFVPALLTGSVGHLCVTSLPVNLMGIVKNTTGQWSGTGVYNNNSFNPANLPTNNYNIVYLTKPIPDNGLCKDSSTISVSVLNPQVPSITQVGPYCSADSPVQLTVTPTVGHWVTTSYLSSNGTFSPGISSVGNNAVQYVVGTSTCNVQQTIQISTEAFVTAAVTSTIPDQCTTGAQLDLSPITINSSGSWTGPGISGTSFNPALSGAGHFTLTYHTSSIPSGLCPDKSTRSVNVFSLATPVITQPGSMCNNAMPFQLKVSPVGGIFGGGVSGAVTQGGVFNPGSTIAGDNIISYSIASGPCIANAQVHINIERFVSADFEKYAATAYCENNGPFNLNSLVQNPGGDWLVNGVPLSGNMFDPSQNKIGENQVTYKTYSYPSKMLCQDTKSITIKIKSIPVISAISNSYNGCIPVEVVLTPSVAGAGYGSWSFGDDSESQKGLTVNHVYTTPGSYNVVFNFEDMEAKSCSAQYTLQTIKVNESPKADFMISSEEVTIANPEVALTNLSTKLEDNRYTWTIPGLNPTNEVNPVITFPQIGTYRITLVATTVENCKDEITRVIEVKNDFNVFIPNFFTPNFDGTNDFFIPVFTPYGLDTKTYLLEIYDRWGHQVFSTKDYTKGWDGTIQNKGDESLKGDVYVYKLRYKDLDGKLYNEMGSVTLLK